MDPLAPQIVLAFIFGAIFITTLIVLAVAFPKPTSFQEGVFRIVLSLAAAGVASMIPGFLNVELGPSIGVLVRAGGALAVFAIVFFFNPARFTMKGSLVDQPWDQVAAICYRVIEGSIEFLLVRTTGGRWTFPKGNVDEGEERWFAAKREAFEEGGASGAIDHRPLTTYLHGKKEWKNQGRESRIEAFLLRVVEMREPQEKGRNPTWFSAVDADKALSEGRKFKYAEELRRVVREAATRISPENM